MPNWCENDLTISGKKERVLELIEFVKSENSSFDFDKIVPFPKELRELTTGLCKIDGVVYSVWHEVEQSDGTIICVGLTEEEKQSLVDKYGTCSWYDWAISNWGTKWNTYDVDELVVRHIKRGHYSAECCFDTAWSPPAPVIRALIDRFPDLNIRLEYFEGGAGYRGGLEYQGCDKGVGQNKKPTDIDAWEGSYHGSRGG